MKPQPNGKTSKRDWGFVEEWLVEGQNNDRYFYFPLELSLVPNSWQRAAVLGQSRHQTFCQVWMIQAPIKYSFLIRAKQKCCWYRPIVSNSSVLVKVCWFKPQGWWPTLITARSWLPKSELCWFWGVWFWWSVQPKWVWPGCGFVFSDRRHVLPPVHAWSWLWADEALLQVTENIVQHPDMSRIALFGIICRPHHFWLEECRTVSEGGGSRQQGRRYHAPLWRDGQEELGRVAGGGHMGQARGSSRKAVQSFYI